VRLRKADLRRPNAPRALLIRNVRKRLFLGVGCELLLKAAFLKQGYAINKLRKGKESQNLNALVALRPDTRYDEFDPDETHKFDHLINWIPKIIPTPQSSDVTIGMKVAKVLRNKEGHVATPSHRYEEDSYRAVEAALKSVYREIFGVKLTVKVAFLQSEKPVWRQHGSW